MKVAPEGAGVLGAEIGLDAAQGEVHHGEAAGGGVALLPVDADVAEPAAVGFDEFFRLHEHAAGTAAGIVNAAFVGSEHLDEEPHDALRSVELAAFLSLGAGKLTKEIFVDATQNIFRAARLVAHSDCSNKVDEFAETILVERWPRVLLWQNAFEPRVIALDRDHRVIDDLSDSRLLRAVLKVCPPRRSRYPENVLRLVFILVFGVGAFFFGEFGVLLLEGIGNVLQKDQTEDDMLVLGCVHVGTEFVGSEPELVLEPNISRVVRVRFLWSSACHLILEN